MADLNELPLELKEAAVKLNEIAEKEEHSFLSFVAYFSENEGNDGKRHMRLSMSGSKFDTDQASRALANMIKSLKIDPLTLIMSVAQND